MKKISFVLVVACAVFALVGCASDTSGDAKLYLTECALPGDGSGMMPGTFELPNGTKVALGSTLMEGSYLYTVGSAKVLDSSNNVDYLASSEQARMVCRESLSNYINSAVSTASGRSSSTTNGKNTTSSGTESASISNSVLQGMEDCGYCLDTNNGVTYILARINVNNIDELDTAQKQVLKKVDKTTDKVIDRLLDKLF